MLILRGGGGGGGERALKTRNYFLINIFQKLPKNAFLACFFKIFPAARRKFGLDGVFIVI